jgi:FkbM family methyltransferase
MAKFSKINKKLSFIFRGLILYREQVRYLKKIKFNDASFVMDVESIKTLFHATSAETKEPQTIDWINDFIKTEDTVYDIGANVGVYSLYIAAKHGPNVQVLSFEPEALNFAQLNRNIYSNNFGDNITAYCFAISAFTEIGKLNLEQWRIGGTVHQFNRVKNHLENIFTPAHKQGVLGVSLDDLVYVYGLPKPNHIKIDVDGLEDLVIQGSKNILKDVDLKTVHMEITDVNDKKVEQIVQAMHKNNFYTYKINEHDVFKEVGSEKIINRTADFTFVREDLSTNAY